MADYYELLGVVPHRHRRRAQAGVPPARPRAAPRRQPRRRRRRRALQGGRAGLRGAVRPRPARPLRPLRRGRRAAAPAAAPNVDDIFAGRARRPVRARSSAAAARFGGGRRGPDAARRVARTSRSSADIAFEQAVFGRPCPSTLTLPQRCADCDGTGAGAGTQPVTCVECSGRGQVQRVRQSLLGQMVTTSAVPALRRPRPGGGDAVPDVPRRGPRHRSTNLPGRRAGRRRHRLDAAPHRPRRGRAARRRRPATCTCTSVWRPRAVPSATATTSSPTVPISIAQAALGTTSRCRRSTATRTWSCRPGTQPGRCSCCGNAACPVCRVAAAATCARARRRGADQAQRRRGGRCSGSSPSSGRGGRRARQGPLLAHQVGVPVAPARGREAAPGSAAHVLVGDIAAPTLDDADAPPPRACAAAPRRRAVTATDGRGAWRAARSRWRPGGRRGAAGRDGSAATRR